MSIFKLFHNQFNSKNTETENTVSNNIKRNSLSATLMECKRFQLDNFIMFTSPCCEYCSKYSKNQKGERIVYSISGKSKAYPSMMIIPADLTTGDPCPICGKYYSFGIYMEGITTL